MDKQGTDYSQRGRRIITLKIIRLFVNIAVIFTVLWGPVFTLLLILAWAFGRPATFEDSAKIAQVVSLLLFMPLIYWTLKLKNDIALLESKGE